MRTSQLAVCRAVKILVPKTLKPGYSRLDAIFRLGTVCYDPIYVYRVIIMARLYGQSPRGPPRVPIVTTEPDCCTQQRCTAL
jgi:hypothetical protein